MRRILLILLVFVLISFACGCTISDRDTSETSTQIIVLPNDETVKNVNGYKEESSEPSSDIEESSDVTSSNTDTTSSKAESAYYVGNKNSKKFHTQYCKYVASISDKNLHSFNNVSDALEQGYSPCGYCLKE